MKKLFGIIGLTALVILGIIEVKDSKTKTNDPVKVAAVFPLTGGAAAYGESARKSAQLAVEEINSQGGINGRSLVIDYQDHKCDPKTAVSLFEQLSVNHKVFLFNGCSGTVLSIAPSLKSKDAVVLATTVAAAKISGISPFVFRNWAIDTKESSLFADRIKQQQYKKVGVIYEETDYAKGLKLALDNLLIGYPVQIVSESFPANATDIRTQLTKLKAENVDVLFISPQTQSTAEAIVAQMEQLNFKPSNILVNDIVLRDAELLSRHPATLEGAYSGDYYIGTERLQELLERYKAKYKTDCPQVNVCAIVYDSTRMLADAIRHNGYSAEGVKNYLSNVSYDGISGRTNFDPNNDRSEAGYTLFSIRNGKPELAQ